MKLKRKSNENVSACVLNRNRLIPLLPSLNRFYRKGKINNNKSVTFDIILFIFYAMPYALFALSFLCFQMQCFQYTNLCFQYKRYVSNIQFMFPNAFLCFQYPIFVSNIQSMFPNAKDVSKRQCFQCMFPIYIEPDTPVLTWFYFDD